MMFEYHSQVAAQDTRNQLGAEGWELVSVTVERDPYGREKEVCHFKRDTNWRWKTK